jgi:tetratricopeptide (TPR) repeat protein
MGTVYEAWQRSLDRPVALKVLAAHVSASRVAVQRFQREAQAAAKLHHMHIIPIFAQGEDQGVYYYAMELVDGLSLHTVLTRARQLHGERKAFSDLQETVPLPRSGAGVAGIGETLSESGGDGQDDRLLQSTVAISKWLEPATAEEQFIEIAQLVADAADGLDYAHSRGVIHRDIKPHNLMFGSDGRLRISDFGLARLTEQPAVTITGEMLGSPMYMSPEQILEGPSKVDARTDVYSLGVTLYEWLTLHPPFPGETREGVISKIVHSDPVPPRDHNPSIPMDLETICLKAIERDRARRYPTAAAMRDDLRRFASRGTILAKRAGVLSKAGKLLARHYLAVFAVLALVVSAGLGVALLRKQGQVKTQTAAAQSAQAETEKMLDVLSNLLVVELGLPREGARAALPVAVPMAQSLFRTAQEWTASPELAASLASQTIPTGTPLGLAQRIARDFYNSVKPADWPPAPSAESPDPSAALLRNAVNHHETNPSVAMEFVESFLGLHSNDYFARQFHAVLAVRLGRFDQAAADAEELVRLEGSNANAYVWRALAYLMLNQGERSSADLSKAVELDAQSNWARTVQGVTLLAMGRAAEAIPVFDGVLERSPDLIPARLGRAAAHAASGAFMQAVADVSKAIDLKPEDADAWAIRGDYYSALGDFNAAVSDFDKAMSIAGQTPVLAMRWFRALALRRQAGDPTALPPLPALSPPQPAPPPPQAGEPGNTPSIKEGGSSKADVPDSRRSSLKQGSRAPTVFVGAPIPFSR